MFLQQIEKPLVFVLIPEVNGNGSALVDVDHFDQLNDYLPCQLGDVAVFQKVLREPVFCAGGFLVPPDLLLDVGGGLLKLR